MPKNIILCSDGTGNSGGKGHGTNVWRLYKAIDLHHSQAQVNIHDDGVGAIKGAKLRHPQFHGHRHRHIMPKEASDDKKKFLQS